MPHIRMALFLPVSDSSSQVVASGGLTLEISGPTARLSYNGRTADNHGQGLRRYPRPSGRGPLAKLDRLTKILDGFPETVFQVDSRLPVQEELCTSNIRTTNLGIVCR